MARASLGAHTMWAVGILFALGCSSGKSSPADTPSGDPATTASAVVSPGATVPTVVSLPNGASVMVPPGAVSVPTTVVIQQTGTQPPGGYSPIYDIGPANTQFAQPVTVSIPIPAGTPLAAGVSIYVSQAQGGYQTIPTTISDGTNGPVASGEVGQVGKVYVGQSCTEGASCSPEPVCRAGVQTCVSGKPACTPTGLLAKDGTGCGGGQVCAIGTCIAPSASGTVSVSGGGTVTLAGGVVVRFPPGSVPSDVAVTVRVVGGTPPPGALSPVLEFLPPMTFAQPVTVSFPIATTPPAGTSIYWSQAGSGTGWEAHPANLSVAGVATAEVTHFSRGFVGPPCVTGTACTVADVCHVGAIACSSGAAVCVDSGAPQPDGTTCGTGSTCSAGSCVAASVVGQWTARVPGSGATVLTFHADGTFTRTTAGAPAGAGTWQVAGNRMTVADGACGTGVAGTYDFSVVSGSLHLALVADSCAARAATASVTWVKATLALCEAGAACSPSTAADPCKTYATACDASGASTCVASGSRSDGTTCGTGLVCLSGSCAPACVPAQSCVPSGSSDPCRTYATACDATLTVSTCSPAGFAPALTACGSGLVCNGAGACIADTVVVVSPATPSVAPGQQVPFSATVNGAPSTAVTWSVREGSGGGTISPSGVYTAPSTTGTYHVDATSTANPARKGSATVTVSAPTQPLLLASPATLSPTVASGGTTLTSVTITNGGAGTLAVPTASVRLADGSAWLSASISGSAAPYAVSVRTSATNMAPGTYRGAVDVASVGATNSPISIPVTFVVTAMPVVVAVAPTAAVLGYGEQATFTATVGAAANGAVDWSVQEGISGGTVSTSGVYTAPSVAGTYHVVATSVADPSRSASATVTVAAGQPVLAPDTMWLAFGGRPGATAPPAQDIAIQNTGTGSLPAPTAIVTYREPSVSGWLRATVLGSAAPYTLRLQTVGPLPAAGQYLAFVGLSAAGAAGSPTQIGVILYVTAGARDVTVVHRSYYVLEDGSPVTINRSPRVMATIRNPEGGPGVTMPIFGNDNGDGTSTIPGVPAGSFFVNGTGAGFLEASGSSVDVSTYTGARPDGVAATTPTPVTLSVSGLAPWSSQADLLQLYSFGASDWASLSASSIGDGATASSGVLADWRYANGNLLAAGDALWLSQLRLTGTTDAIVPTTAYAYWQNVAAGSATGIALANGVPAVASLQLSPAASQATTVVDWKTTGFEAALPSLPPAWGDHTYTLHASAAPVAPVWYASSTLDLIELVVPGGSHDARATFAYGAVAPAAWPAREWFSYDAVVARRAVGATSSAAIAVSSSLWRAASPGAQAAPLVGEVSSPMIAGVDASLAQSGIAPGPLLTWSPPRVGTATHYQVRILEFTPSGTSTRLVRTVRFQTTSTRLQTPEWLFLPGNTYVAKITALNDAGFSEAAPVAIRVPHGTADFVSAAFTVSVPCQAGNTCAPSGTPDLCKTYAITCDPSGNASCGAVGNQPDGTVCGSNLVCQAGTCVDAPPSVSVGGTWHSAPVNWTITNPAGATVSSGSFVAARDVAQVGGAVTIRNTATTGGVNTCTATMAGDVLTGSCTWQAFGNGCTGSWTFSGPVSVTAGSPRTWSIPATTFVISGASCVNAGNTLHVDATVYTEAAAPPDNLAGTYSHFSTSRKTGPGLPPLDGSHQGTWVRTQVGSTLTSDLTGAGTSIHCRGPVIGQTVVEWCYGSLGSGATFSGTSSGTFLPQSPIVISASGTYALVNDPAGYTQMTWTSTDTGGAAYCVAGAGCTPLSPVACTAYAVACDVAGNATCSPRGPAPDGTSCGTGSVCSAGTCVAACVPGVACSPSGTPDPCRTYATSCDATLTHTTCGASGYQPDGTTCGSGLACYAGSCAPSIAGTQLGTYWTDGGTVTVPYSGASVQAIFGPLAAPTATLSTTVSNGAFLFLNTPVATSYWLRFQGSAAGSVPSYVESGASAIDLGQDVLGRTDAARRTAFTSVGFTLSGLTAWTPGTDGLECTSSNGSSVAYLFGTSIGAGIDPFPAGTTSISPRRSWPSYAGLIDASRGDVAVFHQLVSHSVTVGGVTYPYSVAENAYTTNAFTVTNGATTANAVTVPMTPIATGASLAVDWRGSQFAAHLAEMGPSAVATGSTVAVEGAARDPIGGVPLLSGYGGWPDLLVLGGLPGTDVNLGTLSFGNPFPAPWGLFRLVRYEGGVSLLAAGATTPKAIGTFIESLERFPVAAGPIIPAITPVRNVRLNGLDASAGVRGVTTSPTITWDEPTVFPVGSSYIVWVNRLSTDATGATVATAVASFRTSNRSLQLPPGILAGDSEYYLHVTATWDPSAPVATRPFRYGAPQASASYVSGIFTTSTSRTVTVGQVTTYHPDSGPVQSPASGTALTLTYGPSGSSTTLTATVSNGAASFANVPWGTYALRMGATVAVTDATSVDLGVDVLGRPSQARPTGFGTTIATLDLSQMTPWVSTSDELEYFSSNAGAVGYLASTTDLADGVTAAPYTVDWYGTLATLPDPAQGDHSTFTQLATRTVTVGGTSYTYGAVDRVFDTSTFGLVNGTPATFAVPFQAPASTGSISVDWRGTSFAAFLPDLGTGLAAVYGTVNVGGYGFGDGSQFLLAQIGGWPDLLVATSLPVTDVNLGTLAYGWALPPTMDAFVASSLSARKSVTAPGATGGTSFWASVWSYEYPWGAATHPIAPQVGPVRSLAIAGQAALGSASAVGLTPVVSWVAPATVPGPIHYSAYVYRVYRTSPTATTTSRTMVLRYLTPETSFQIPAGFLQAGEQYVLVVSVAWEPWTAWRSAPFRSTLPQHGATTISNPFTP